jgi:UDP-N-acetylmuramate dehydrogenase
MFDIQQDVPLAPLTTFGVGGNARYFSAASTEADIPAAFSWAHDRGLPVFILGGGSNLLVRDTGFAGLVLRMGILGVTETEPGNFNVGAGEPWDTFVSRMVAAGMAGIECMAGIPGSTGGTPVQNVGAYGQEVSETITSVRAFDRQTQQFVELTREQCRFRYRESLFNTDEPNRYVVTQVRFQLRPAGPPTLRYAELAKRFEGHTAPTLAEVAAAVRVIRQSKGMLLVEGDPNCRSAGSFFKNPIVPSSDLPRIAAGAGVSEQDVPSWPTADGKRKLPAAWLLEKAGFVKGFADGPVGISTRHTLALINRGNAAFADVEKLQDEITAVVAEKFCVVLEREPVVMS